MIPRCEDCNKELHQNNLEDDNHCDKCEKLICGDCSFFYEFRNNSKQLCEDCYLKEKENE